jgi:hypothetical protein
VVEVGSDVGASGEASTVDCELLVVDKVAGAVLLVIEVETQPAARPARHKPVSRVFRRR